MGRSGTRGRTAVFLGWLAAAGVLLYGAPVHSAVEDGSTPSKSPGVAAPRLAQQQQQQQQQVLPPPATCPGRGGGICALPCQRATCNALAAFFRITYNESSPWQHPETWEITRTTPCDRIVPDTVAGRLPPYCGWYGITCCKPADAAAGLCHVVDGVSNLTIAADTINGSYSNPELMDALEQLHACGMVALNLESSDMSGEVLPRWGRFTNLTVLNLANSWLSGTIPPELANLKRLKHLELGTNFLQGTIPSWIGSLAQLEVLNLGANAGVNDPDPETGEERTGFVGPIPSSLSKLTRLVELDLQLNALTGTIPSDLCGPNTQLRVLNLRGNHLTGPAAPVKRCRQLASLDLGFNKLTGSLPASKDWTNLVSLMLGRNQFTGQVPDDLYLMPLVTYMEISGNRLEGPLTDGISLLIYLTELDAADNNFSGEVGSGLFFLPQIARVNIANNNFTGILDTTIGLAFNLQELILVNNSGIIGQLPDEAAGLSFLRRVGLFGTSMSCEPSEVAEAQVEAAEAGKPPPPVYRCPDDALLPCFLEFESYDIPRGDSSHMRCRPIKRKALDDVMKTCPPAAMAQDADPSNEVLAAQWDLPPSYYQYQGCHCLDGYKAVWSKEGTRLECVEDRWAALPPWTWVLIALGAVLALLAASLLLLGRRLVLLRSRWNREMELRRKRKQGLPQDGEFVSVAVTDVEGYSCLMKASPRLATKALAMHNAVLRKAAHDHAGILVEQEGDSWAVAFHEAQDAVAFCMQAQQALHKVDWPLGLMGRRGSGELPTADSINGSTRGDGSEVASRPGTKIRQLLGVGSLGMVSMRSSQGESWLGPLPGLHTLQLAHMGSSSFSSRAPSHDHDGREELSGAYAQHSGANAQFGAPSAQHSGANAQDDESERGVLSNSRTSSQPQLMQLRDASKSSGQGEAPSSLHGASGHWNGDSGSQGGGGTRSSGPSGRLPQAGGHRNFFSALLRQSDSGGPGDELSGLRVRMGVACGMMPVGMDICSSGVFDLAKVISDMGNGGQVLIDSATFDLVKDNPMLAAVDHHGYNDKLLVGYSGLASITKSWRLLPCFKPCGEEARSTSGDGSRLVFLEMGEFKVPGINTAAARGQHPSGNEPGAQGVHGAAANAQFRRRSFGPQRSAVSASSKFGRRHQQERLRMFSVLPPCLAERARVWGGSLSLKEGWRQTDRGFFDAPGAAAALLTPQGAAATSICDSLPQVTMVFAAVDGAKLLVRWRRAGEVRQVARLLRLVLRASLDAVPGGYLCRQQEGDLRYMLAFPTAESALQWCLLVQEALMYAPWPPALLEMAEFAERRAPGDGALLFRGPRLKMGVCEGRPRTLEPDHLGRADYFGANVNQAARYTDVAAHGGQVACEAALVESVFSEWRLQGTQGPRAGEPHGPSALSPPAGLPAALAEGSPFTAPRAAVPRPGAAAPGAATGGRDHLEMASHSTPLATAGPVSPSALSPRALSPLVWPMPEGRQWPLLRQSRQGSEDGAGSGRGPESGTDQQGAVRPQEGAHQQRRPQDSFDVEMGRPSGIPGLLRTLSGTRMTRPLLTPRRGPLMPSRSLSARAAAAALYEQQAVALGGMRRLGADIGSMIGTNAAGIQGFHQEDELPRHNITVRALHLGTFVFKGSDTLDMVSVTTAALAPRQELLPHCEAKGKGMMIEERSGVADGAVVSLPDMLPGLKEVFVEASGEEDGGGGGLDAKAAAATGYASWLSQELARRRLCAASDSTSAPLPGSRRAQSFTVQQHYHAPFGAMAD